MPGFEGEVWRWTVARADGIRHIEVFIDADLIASVRAGDEVDRWLADEVMSQGRWAVGDHAGWTRAPDRVHVGLKGVTAHGGLAEPAPD